MRQYLLGFLLGIIAAAALCALISYCEDTFDSGAWHLPTPMEER